MISQSEINDQWTLISVCIPKSEVGLDSDVLREVFESVTEEMFTDLDCRKIWRTFKALHSRGLPTDIYHLIDELDRTGQITQESAQHLGDLACQTQVITAISHYADRVKDSYIVRCLKETLFRQLNLLECGTPINVVLTNLGEMRNKFSVNAAASEKRPRHEQKLGFTPIPVSTFPKPMATYIRTVSAAIGCDESFVVLPMLTVAASSIGTSRKLMLKRGWYVPSILWAVVIGESGTQKSPPMRIVLSPLQARQTKLHSLFHSDMKEYHQKMTAFRQASRKKSASHTSEPELPICSRCIVNDTTLEGLVPILQQNPRGVLLARDEVVGWIGSFDKYSGKGRASADVAQWLSIYNGENIIVDRKTGDKTTLFVPNSSVSVCGGIQPGVLQRVLTNEHRENGLAARLLMAYPPRQPKKWRDEEIPDRVEKGWSSLVERLFELEHSVDSDGKSQPQIIRLNDEALRLYRQYVNTTGEEQYGMTGDLAAAWSKLEEIPARLALVLHCVRQVSGENVAPLECDGESMRAAIQIATWFKRETERIYSMLTESTEDRRLQEIAEWIQTRGGVVRPRDLIANRRDIQNAQEADEIFVQLANQGFGQIVQVPSGKRGGRATIEFHLFQPVGCEQSAYDPVSAEPNNEP